MDESDSLFWERVLAQRLKYHRAVILFGNIHDNFPAAGEDGERGFEQVLQQVLQGIAERADFAFEPLDLLAGRPGRNGRDLSADVFQPLLAERPQHTYFFLSPMPVAFPNVESWDENDWQRHEHLLDAIRDGERHRFLLVFPDEGRIPGNFLTTLPGVTRLAVPVPEARDREAFARRRMADFFRLDEGAAELDEERLRRFVGLSEGFHWRDLTALAEEDDRRLQRDPAALVRAFKFGQQRDHWRELLKERSRLTEARQQITEKDSNPLLGQDEAVDKALKVVVKACFGLGSIVAPAYNRPKGVLFFVGPTGVGKTMLAKKLAKLVFGHEERCLVFDMSEYSEPQSEARLVGSPPGYVGHDAGGQLTRIVHQQPFSVILFDEIDKADGSILTKFLQILDEGRLTDGKGQTCYFSEALIIFTSNIGALQLAGNGTGTAVRRDSDYEDLLGHYRAALASAPALENHPEILNRIGLANIVPFRHILDVTLVYKVVDGLLRRTQERFEELSDPVYVNVDDPESLYHHIAELAEWRDYGMRNVAQTFESEVLECLAQKQLDNELDRNLRLSVADGKVVVKIEG